MNNLVNKMLAEFIGVALFVTAIYGAVISGSGIATIALATTLGLMILMTAGISGGHLNPAVSLYFFARKEIDAQHLLSYIVAQLAGGFVGAVLGSTIWQKTIQAPSMDNGNSAATLVSEFLATAVLVWLVGTLAKTNRGALIPAAVGLWVAAAAAFTPTGAQANPAVSFGLLFFPGGGHPVGTQAGLVLVQLAGALVALVLINFFDQKPAKK
jgi:glycerol uptake facilitator-like aquaporin